MRYLQKDVETYGVSDEELSQVWDSLSEEEKAEIFLLKAEMADVRKRHDVVTMELGNLSEVCSEETVQGVIDSLLEIYEEKNKK